MERSTIDAIMGEVVDAGIRVHSVLGPGLLESAYEACLFQELRTRGMTVVAQVPVSVVYRESRVELAYRIDLLVQQAVVIELKTVPRLLPIHEAQLLSYLRLGSYPAGLLMNFHAPRLKEGLKRMMNGFSHGASSP